MNGWLGRIHRKAAAALALRPRLSSAPSPAAEKPKPSLLAKKKAKPVRPRRAADRPRRAAFALDRMQEGYTDREVMAGLAAEFGIAPQQARRDLDTAYRELGLAAAARTPEEKRGRAILQRDFLIRRSLAGEKPELRLVLSALESRDKMLGLLDRESFQISSAAQTLLEAAQDALSDDDPA